MSDYDERARQAADAVRRRIAALPADHEAGIRRAQRSSPRVAIPAAVAAAVLIGAVAIGVPRIGGIASGGNGSGADGAAAALTGALTPFDSCDSVLQYFKDQSPEYLIARVSGGTAATDSGGRPVWGTAVPDQARDTVSAAGAAESSASSPDYSTTNIQEVGVDEPDIVKTDGNRIVAVAEGRVHLISAAAGDLSLRTTLPGTTARNVFLSGDRLLVFSDQQSPSIEPESSWIGARSVLTTYDLSNLDDPRLIATLIIDGDVIDARLVGTLVRVVTVASPDLDVPAPRFTPDGRVTDRSKDMLRDAVARTTVEDWMPSYVLADGRGVRVDQGHLVECADLARPERFSGLDTVALSSFDLGSDLRSRETVGVIAGGQQIYASSTSTYVSTTEWSRDGSPATTSVHKFVTAQSGASAYWASGEIPGVLINQYAMSEYGGVLRVATTVSESRGWVDVREVTEGVVTTLQEQDGALRQLGQVGGLGRQDNESIQAVRFIEERGYVVTFRRTDPLYVLDLRDPAAPKVLGELKIAGYSGYLHPIGADLLLGVGQSGATPDSSSRSPDAAAGVQFSLFDVSDPASPRRIDTSTFGAGAAAAEFDPKAFLYWQPRDLIIAPTSLYGDDQGGGVFNGVVILRATESGFKELGRIAVAYEDGMANRSFVIGDAIYLLSDHALQSTNVETLQQIDKLTF